MGEDERRDQYEDVAIECADCRETFTWSAGEQAFYAEKGFMAPKRCKTCRDKRKAQREAQGQDQGRGRDRGGRDRRGHEGNRRYA